MKMRKISRFVILLLILAVFPVFCNGDDAKYPGYTGYVTDNAGILSSSRKDGIEKIIKGVEDRTGAEIAVLTVDTTEPVTIEEYAVTIFKKWGIGKKGKDNGVLLVVAAKDRKLRIEVGYGLEGALTDIESKMIIDGDIVPSFKKSDFGAGIYAGVIAIARRVCKEYGVEWAELGKESRKLKKEARQKEEMINLLFMFGIMAVFAVQAYIHRGRKGTRGYWVGGGGSFGGGFGGGGFGGFGGGGSGGGGSSGGW